MRVRTREVGVSGEVVKRDWHKVNQPDFCSTRNVGFCVANDLTLDKWHPPKLNLCNNVIAFE